MNIEEQFLREKLNPKENPFKVPDGYFDTFADRVMQKIPEDAKVVTMRSNRKSSRGWAYAAACLLLCVCSVVGFYQFESAKSDTATTAMASTTDSFDEAADYVMMDNQDIYACLMND